MATRPTIGPEWADSGDLLDPGSSKRDTGWLLAEAPAHNHMNFMLNNHGAWIKWLEAGGFITSLGWDRARLKELTPLFNLGTDNPVFDPPTLAEACDAFHVSANGEWLYCLDEPDLELRSYQLTTPYRINTAVADTTAPISVLGTSANSLFVSPDGTKLFWGTNSALWMYELPVPYELSSQDFTSPTPAPINMPGPAGLKDSWAIDRAGERVFIAQAETVTQMDLTTAWTLAGGWSQGATENYSAALTVDISGMLLMEGPSEALALVEGNLATSFFDFEGSFVGSSTREDTSAGFAFGAGAKSLKASDKGGQFYFNDNSQILQIPMNTVVSLGA